MRLIRPSVVVFMVLLLAATTALNVWSRWTWSDERLPLANMDAIPYTVRVIDEWTGRPVATGRLEPGDVVIGFEGRSAEWWVDADASFQRQHGFRLEVVGDGCVLTSSGVLDDNGVDAVTVIWDGSVSSTDWDSVGRRPRVIPKLQPGTDPCAGKAPIPRGEIVNRTLVPVSVGHGIVVPACASVTILPGDLPEGDVPEPRVPLDAVRVIIPSIDAQDERWPMEPRSILISDVEISDSWGTLHPEANQPCAGSPRPGATPFL